MFIFSAKLTRKKLSLVVLASGAFLCVIIMLVSLYKSSTYLAGYSKVETALDRAIFIRSFGWEVDENPAEVAEVTIPQEFDSVYSKYNQLQKAQGFNLETCAGKKVKQYTYEVINYPTGEAGVLIHLLVYKDTVVGADVMSPRLDGFMHGLLSETAD
ncbi:MAG: DUF4830 domain-containing protein [Oscillospiraceae bacterium]|jgi:hypothetical protein|nr:DUF4830 domain-containing protein [Oscillospiraceae bacterium]